MNTETETGLGAQTLEPPPEKFEAVPSKPRPETWAPLPLVLALLMPLLILFLRPGGPLIAVMWLWVTLPYL